MIIKVLKFLFAYIAYLFSFSFRKNIALVSEKEDEARDNGIYFFRYAVAHCTNEKVYYVIRKGSSDYVKIRDYNKRVVFWDSFRHYYLIFCCGKIISSQAYC